MQTPPDPCFVVDLTISSRVTQAHGAPLPREDFLTLMWDLLDGTGLLGIHEGTIDATGAFDAGITPSAMVIDAAAGAPDRDWVAACDTTTAALWFGDERGARAAAALLEACEGCSLIGVRREETDDWEALSRAAHGPIDVPGFGTIVPPWVTRSAVASPPSGTTLVIEPGSGFGTGLHATTKLCLAALAGNLPGPSGRALRVLDFGAGSGILAIAAAVRGATAVDAIEVDDRVHAAIRSNAALNQVAERVVVATTLDEPGTSGRYDIILANIVAPVLLAHAAPLSSRLAPAGTLILSGLLAEDVAAVATDYRQRLGREPHVTTLDGWHCLRFTGG